LRGVGIRDGGTDEVRAALGFQRQYAAPDEGAGSCRCGSEVASAPAADCAPAYAGTVLTTAKTSNVRAVDIMACLPSVNAGSPTSFPPN